MKLAVAGMAIVALIAGSAVAQTNDRPPADPLAVKPIPPQAQVIDTDVIRTKIEGAGYADVSGLSRDSMGVWRARAKKGDEAFDIVVDKGGRIKAERR
jgi:hypothetical protein